MTNTADSEPIDTYVEGIACLCEEMAALFIDGGLPPFASDPAEHPMWDQDRERFRVTLGTEVPTAWIIRTIQTYLGESAHELRAVASVLRARIVTGSIGPLVRSITERVGATTWILDPKVDAIERGWRAMLNVLVCWSEYSKAVERLGAESDETVDLAAEQTALRNEVRTWFSPSVNARDPDSERRWKRGASGYPRYTDLAVGSLPSTGEDDPFDQIKRKGLYSAQCGMTHPNVVVSRETVEISDEGLMRFVHRWEHVDKEVRVGFHSLSWGYRAWAWYFCKESDTQAVMEKIVGLSERLDDLASWDD